MNKKAYYRDLIKFKESLDSDEFQTLIDVVKIFDDVHAVTCSLSYTLFTQSDQETIVRQEKTKVVQTISRAIEADKRQTKMRHLLRCTIVIEQLVTDIIDRNPNDSKIKLLFSDFIDYMDRFLEQHESYRVSFSPHNVYTLSVTADRLMMSIRGLTLAIDTILDNYLPEASNDEPHLELYLSHVPSLKQFGTKLQLIDDMYIELCNLCDLSLTDNPIVIEHIENGSLLARISGNPLVVGILLQVLGSSATYFITNYPANNEMVEMKETVATLDDMFELSQKLKDEGYEVDGMQDNIHRSLKKLAGSAEELLNDQPTIEVNEKVFELDGSNKTKLLEESKRKLLENKYYMNDA